MNQERNYSKEIIYRKTVKAFSEKENYNFYVTSYRISVLYL